MKDEIQLFEGQQVRHEWDGESEEWYFSVVDVIGVLTDSVDPTAYWRKLKQRLISEGNQTVTNCHGLKMQAADGKMRLTDVVTTEQLLRLIQSIPSFLVTSTRAVDSSCLRKGSRSHKGRDSIPDNHVEAGASSRFYIWRNTPLKTSVRPILSDLYPRSTDQSHHSWRRPQERQIGIAVSVKDAREKIQR